MNSIIQEIRIVHEQTNVLKDYMGDKKLYVYDNALVKHDSYGFLQPAVRMVYGYGRETIYLFLKIVLTRYINLIVQLKECNSVYAKDIEDKNGGIREVRDHCRKLLVGLLALQLTYPNYKELIDLIQGFKVTVGDLIFL